MSIKNRILSAALALAVKLDKFGEEYDTYDYYDVVEDRETSIESTKDALITQDERIDGIKVYLQSVIDEDRWYLEEARLLLDEIEKFEQAVATMTF